MDNDKVFAGRYKVGELIGSGGMANVYVGTDERLNRKIAIKVLKPQFSDDPIFQARFRREAQSAAGLTNANIVGVYDSGEETTSDEGGKDTVTSYIVMEYVEGKTLRDILLSEGSLDVDDASEIIQNVLKALTYSHKMGIIHRDIKPGNVMITSTGEVKVMDFGIARAVTDLANTMTQSQGVVGTAQYLSPEQARGEKVDSRSDLYSVGCLFFELLTGRPPFLGDSPVAIAYQHVREIPPLPSDIKPGIPQVYNTIINKALAKDVDHRYATAEEFNADLSAAAAGNAVSDEVDPDVTRVMTPVDDDEDTMFMAPVNYGDDEISVGNEFIDEVKKRKRLIIIISAVVAAIIAIIVLVVILLTAFSDNTPEKVKVPTLTKSMGTDQACKMLENSGLKCEIVDDGDSSEEKGKITGQDPASGTEVDKGTTVKIKVSTGPAEGTIPSSIVGGSFDDAKKALEDAGFIVTVKKANDARKADCVNPGTITDKDELAINEEACQLDADKVAGTKPAVGTKGKKGDTVNIYISSGSAQIPKVIGQTKDAAKKILESMHLKVVDGGDVINNDIAEGSVAEQTPGESDQKIGSTVTLKYAKAEQKATVPNLIDKDEAYARGQLEALGFKVVVEYVTVGATATNNGKVQNVDNIGQSLKVGSTVTIKVYKYNASTNPAQPGTGSGNNSSYNPGYNPYYPGYGYGH